MEANKAEETKNVEAIKSGDDSIGAFTKKSESWKQGEEVQETRQSLGTSSPKPEAERRQISYAEVVGMLDQAQTQLRQVMAERQQLYQQIEFFTKDFSQKMLANAIAVLPHLDKFSTTFQANVIELIEACMTPEEEPVNTPKQ